MRIYLAAPSQMYLYDVPIQTHRLLISFVKLSWKIARFEKALTNGNPSGGFCFDSGAHVWLSSYFKSNIKPPETAVEAHLTNFIAVVRQLPSVPQFIVDLDIQKIYGMPTIQGWRENIWMPFEEETGIRVCYVWHPADGEAAWDALLDDPRVHYLGMGTNFKAMPTKDWARLIFKAYQAGKPVHGFAKVSGSHLMQVPFYSVDSTSWAAGTFFGTVPDFDARRGVMVQRPVGDRAAAKHGQKKVLTRLAKSSGGGVGVGVLQGGSSGKDFTSFYNHAALEYEKAERWYTSYWKARGVDWDAKLSGLHAAR
jgi:hypothetical protein